MPQTATACTGCSSAAWDGSRQRMRSRRRFCGRCAPTPGLRHADQLGAWVTTIAERVVIDAHRRSRVDGRAASRPSPGTDAPRTRSSSTSPASLPPTERAAVVLRYGYDLDYEQIGAVLGSNATRRQAGGLGGRAPSAKGARMTLPTNLDARFRDAAAAAGLLDAAYDVTDSPVGELLLAATDRGVCWIEFSPEETLDRLARQVGTRLLRVPRRLTEREARARRVLLGQPDRRSTSTWTWRPCRRSSRACSRSWRASPTAR